MRIIDIYRTAVNIGMKMDPRGRDKVKKELLRTKKEFDKLSPKEQEFYDKERFTNPYSDTRILFGTEDAAIKNILVGIDIEVAEILLADRLRERGEKIDLLLGHHPEGSALAGFFNVMYMQVDIFNKIGVPVNVAEHLMSERIKEVERKVSPVNHMRPVDAARMLNIPYMTCHTPSDNCVSRYLQNLIDKKKPYTMDDVIDLLNSIPEYNYAAKNNMPPKIIAGHGSSKAGKIFVDMTGGTEGPKEIFGRLSDSGVSTVVCMHLSEEHFKKVSEEHINVIVAGHIASDNLGLNILLDELGKKERGLKILECSGFKRFSRI